LACSLLSTRLGLVIVVAGLGGCFTSPVNMPPEVTIVSPPDRVERGQPAIFTALASDPDGEVPHLDWELEPRPCAPDDTLPSHWGGTSQSGPSFPVMGKDPSGMGKDTSGPFCVLVRATDAYGATSIAAANEVPYNHPPVPMIKVVAPTESSNGDFPVNAAFSLSAEDSVDVDPGDKAALTFTFRLTIGQGTPQTLPPCEGNAKTACFTATTPGDFDVELQADDGTDKATVHKILRVVPGKPPVAKLDLVSPTAMGPMASGPYPLGTTFRFSAMRSMAADSTPPMPTFHLDVKPTESKATVMACDATSPFVACFTADLAGPYSVSVAVVANGLTTTASQDLIVDPDRLPCIAGTTPAMTTAPIPWPVDMDLDFQLNHVDDDLDSYPSGALFDAMPFNWFVIEGAGPPVLKKASSSDYKILMNERRLGDVIKVRLEIRDRLTDRSAAHLFDCGNDDICKSTEGCYQRWTWTVKFQ
jgi:hypothetical protein